MLKVERTSDVIEVLAERALSYGFGGLASSIMGGILYYYRGQSGMFVPLAIVLGAIGLGLLGYSAFHALKIRKVTAVSTTCPYCQTGNHTLTVPESDFMCVNCARLIPIQDGAPVSVQQVRCGYCNELNYYSEKTDILLCENCNHEVPISTDDDRPKKTLAAAYAVVDDDSLYELILTGHGNKIEELIATLQSMLALNRNQVKQMLEELPVTLLTGIPRRKAEMLKAQLTIHDGIAEMVPLASAETTYR